MKNIFLDNSSRSSVFGLQSANTKTRTGQLAPLTTLEDIVGDRARGDQAKNARFLGSSIRPGRFRAALIAVFCIFLIFLCQAAYLQIWKRDYYDAQSARNRIRTVTLPSARGKIFDRHGAPLADNAPSFILTMSPALLPKDETQRESVIGRIMDLAGLQRAEIDLLITKYAAAADQSVPLKKGMDYETAMRLSIETANLPGFELKTGNLRVYNLTATSLAHVIGYTGNISEAELSQMQNQDYRLIDDIGKTGLEKSAEAYLRGNPGKYQVEVDALGRELSVVSRSEPMTGANLILSLDFSLQRLIEEELYEIFRETSTSRAAVVVMDPKNGEILALVSLPAFDSNLFAQGIDAESYQALINNPDKPLFFRAVSGEYPSGSIFKPFIAYAALREGVISEKTSFLSTGGIAVGPWFFPDWRAGGHGQTDVRKALADSVNTFFYIVGGGYKDITGLGVDKITSYARQFGFGGKTGINLPAESNGFLPSREWKEQTKGERWYVGDTYNLSIGQGDLLVTPLQMAAATSIIANGGHPVTPRLIRAIDGNADAVDLFVSSARDQEFDASALRIVAEGLRRGVTLGSSRYLAWLDMDVAGKTGTAQNIGGRPTHAWWAGYGPYQNPEIAVTILVEEGGEGSTVAVPLAYKIFAWWQAQRKL